MWSFSKFPMTSVSFHPVQQRLLACDTANNLYVLDTANLFRVVWSASLTALVARSRVASCLTVGCGVGTDIAQNLFQRQRVTVGGGGSSTADAGANVGADTTDRAGMRRQSATVAAAAAAIDASHAPVQDFGDVKRCSRLYVITASPPPPPPPLTHTT